MHYEKKKEIQTNFLNGEEILQVPHKKHSVKIPLSEWIYYSNFSYRNSYHSHDNNV